MPRAGWYAARALELGARELPLRVREQVRRTVDRRRSFPDVAPGLAPRWPAPVVLDTSARAAIATAERQILADGFPLLGARIAPDRRDAWRTDPRTGDPWPAGYAFDLDLHRRDPKPTWELHRLQHLQLLALGSGDAVAATIADLRSWLTENPPWRGIAWASGLEVACRVVSLIRIADALRERLPPDVVAAVRTALAAHGSWLERYPSVGSSVGNHRVAEAAALVLLGATTDLPSAGRWLALGRRALADALPRLILTDGVGAEMATAYLAFTLEWALLARLATPLGAGLDGRISDAACFLGTLLDASGHCPRIGDDDDGVVLRTAFPEDRYVASIVGAAGAVLDRPDLVPVGWHPDLRARLLGAPDIRGTGRRWRGRTFPIGGVTVLASRRLRVVVDHGPLGLPALAAHGHADALAVWVHLDGHPLIVGRGTSGYRGAAERGWQRGTAAHNTVVVDERDQSEPRGDPFLWRTRARARLEHVRVDDEGGIVEATHDGYARIGVIHRRVVALEHDVLRIVDEVTGVGRHRIVIVLHLAPDLAVERIGRGAWTLRRGGHVVARLTSERDGAIAALGPGHAVRYGEIVPAASLVITADVDLPFVHALELAPGPPG